MSDELSIAIPFYAGLEYFTLALDSVLAQEDPRWRLLVVDDSPEECGVRERVEERSDPRLRYLRNPRNLGMVGCWNRCLDEAEGALVTLLHADDELLPDYVGLVRRLAAEHPTAVAVFTASRTIGAEGWPLRTLQDDIKRFFVPRGSGAIQLTGEPGLRALMRGNFLVCPTLCWRRSVLGERRFDPAWRQVQDLELSARLLLSGERLVGSRTAAYAYRRHAANTTALQTESLLRFEEEFQLFDRIAAQAAACGWRSAARTARRKTIVRLHLSWRVLAEFRAGRPGVALRTLGFLCGAGREAALIAGATGGVLAVSLTGLALVFGANLLLARALGAEEYGALTYTLTWAEVLGMLAPLGFDKLLIREFAHLSQEPDRSQARRLLAVAMRWTLVGVLASSAAVLLFALGLGGHLDPVLVPVFWLTLLLVPLRAWANLGHGALLGLSRPVAGTMAASVTWALVLLPLCALVWVLAPHGLSARGAAWAAAGAWLVAAALADHQVRARLESGSRGPERNGAEKSGPGIETPMRGSGARAWLASAVPMLLIAALALLSLRADVIMLGALRGAREAGIYAAAASIAFLVRLGLVAVRPAVAPLLVQARTSSELASVARRASRLAFLPALPVAAGLLIAGPWILRLYSPEFADGSWALRILTLGFLLDAARGPVETILLMRHQLGLAAKAAAGACSLNLLLNAVLIPLWGMEGAALATVASLSVWGMAMSLAVRKRFGFGMSVLARADVAGEGD